MCASFRWKSTEDSESWEADGTSAPRKTNGQQTARRFWTPGKITLAALVGLLAIFSILGFAYKIEDRVSASGTVEPLDITYIKSPQKATIQELGFREGDYVQKAQLLVRLYPDSNEIFEDIEDKELEIQNLEKECQQATESVAILKKELAKSSSEKDILEKDDSEIKSCTASIQAAEVELKQKQNDCKRCEDLFAQGLIATRELENASVARDMAAARLQAESAQMDTVLSRRKIELENLEKQIGILGKKITVAELGCSRKEEELNTTRHQLESALTRKERLSMGSPIAGTIARLDKKEGDHVEPGELIMIMTASADLKIKALVPAKDAYKIKLGQPVRIFSRSYSSVVYGHAVGSVIQKSTYLRNEGSSSGRLPIFVRIDESPFPLDLGSSVETRIIVGKRRLLFPSLPDDENSLLANAKEPSGRSETVKQ